MKLPITAGTYRLRNGDIVDVTWIGELVVTGPNRNTGERMAWDKRVGMFSANPTSWDLVERIEPPTPSTITILRREHAVMMTIADSHAAISKQAMASAQEIEHRIREMERIEA